MALDLGNNSSRFSQNQQGSVDWVALARTTISASVSVFARLAAADIDPQTLAVGHAIAGNFHLSQIGQLRVHEALSHLKWCSSLGDLVQFGFGIDHPVRHLARTANGYSCLALLGALSELSTNPEAAAMILSELSDILNTPRDLRPSLRQWRAMVHACEGIFAATNLGCFSEHFIRLGRSSHGFDQVGVPRDVAEALNALSKISRGELSSIDLVGSSTCGWLAAFGHWFFGLDVEIRQGDGTVVYKSVPDQTPIQISILYGTNSTKGSLLKGTSYVVRDAEDLISTAHPLFLGKVKWVEVLRTGYGAAGRMLIKAEATLSLLLCSVSHMFQAVAQADSAVSDELQSVLDEITKTSYGSDLLLQGWVGYHEDSYGLGFLNLGKNLLPELKGLDAQIGSFARAPLAKSISSFESALMNLTRLCSCTQCRNTAGEGSDDSDQCICLVAESIVILIWTCSLLDIDRDIQPSRFGLEDIYDQWKQHLTADIPYGQRRIGILLKYLDCKRLINFAEELFTGTETITQGPFEDTANFSSYGMCFLTSNLIKLSDRPDQARVLRVLPGAILSPSGAQYQRIKDAQDPNVNYRARNYQTVTSLGEGINTGTADLQSEIMAKETLDELLLSFRFKGSEGSIWGIGPAILVKHQLCAAGRVSCRHGAGCKPISLGSIYSLDGEGSVEEVVQEQDEFRVIVRQTTGNPLARIAALCTTSLSGNPAEVIFRVNECLNCCIRKAQFCRSKTVYIIA